MGVPGLGWCLLQGRAGDRARVWMGTVERQQVSSPRECTRGSHRGSSRGLARKHVLLPHHHSCWAQRMRGYVSCPSSAALPSHLMSHRWAVLLLHPPGLVLTSTAPELLWQRGAPGAEAQLRKDEAKPCSELLIQHHLPEEPPCLCPGVNELEIIRADSHLVAVCGHLLLEQPL